MDKIKITKDEQELEVTKVEFNVAYRPIGWEEVKAAEKEPKNKKG